MAKLIGITSGDWHLNDWKQFNDGDRRLDAGYEFLDFIFKRANKNKVPIYFTGDLFHTPDALSNKLLDYYLIRLKSLSIKYPNVLLIGITGNHDLRLGADSEYYSYVKTLSGVYPEFIKCIDNISYFHKGVTIHGIPYTKHNKGFNKSLEALRSGLDSDVTNILLIHTSLYGAKDPSGYEVEEVPNIPRNLGKFFKGFDLVLSGHIHKQSRLWKNKVYMVGAPYQQRSSDAGTEMGFMEIYDDCYTKFIPYSAPEFKFYTDGTEPGDNYNYWIKIPKAENFKKEVEVSFDVSQSRSKLAEEYCKIKGINNKRRISLLSDILTKADD
jgi:DNA repair exonuclease SbcCD nuclease subunit